VTARSKGLDLEKKLRRHLEAKGFLVHQARAASKQVGGRWYTNQNDVFGVFDLIAVRGVTEWDRSHPEIEHGEMMWIQVTTETGASHRRGKLAAFLDQLPPLHPIFYGSVLAIHYDRNGWRFQHCLDPAHSVVKTSMPRGFHDFWPSWWADGLKPWKSRR